MLSLVGGKHDYSSAALGLLVAEGYVRTEQDGREKRHYSIRPVPEGRRCLTGHHVPDPHAIPTPIPGTGCKGWDAIPGRRGT